MTDHPPAHLLFRPKTVWVVVNRRGTSIISTVAYRRADAIKQFLHGEPKPWAWWRRRGFRVVRGRLFPFIDWSAHGPDDHPF